MRLVILFPVLNEELRLENGILKTIQYMDSQNYTDYELLIVDNGSVDRTKEIANNLCEKYENVRYLWLEERGVGIAFREGVKNSESDIIGYMDVDLSTDISHLSDMLEIFNNNIGVDIVNGSRLHKNSDMKGRKWYRNITSYGLKFCMKLLLGMKSSDAICGFKFYRRERLIPLMKETDNENGWFYIIELLIRAERNNYNIVELPVRWQDEYHTTVDVVALIKNYLTHIMKLRKQLKKEKT